MDGIYNADSLCFVLSNRDRDFNTALYLNRNPDVQDTVSNHTEKLSEKKDRLAVLSSQRESVFKAFNQTSSHMMKLQDETLKLKSQQESYTSSSNSLLSVRKRGAGDADNGMFILINP